MTVQHPGQPSCRTLRAEGLVNARDLGGLRRRDGTSTCGGVFYRSENVDWVTEQGWEQIHDEGIRTVVDLRQPGERQRDTNGRPDWLTTVEVDLDGLERQDFWKDYWDNGLVGTALYFLPHMAAMPERAGAALSAIVGAPPGGVLFHCMGGRDRTGMVAMLLLAAVDTDPDEIVLDYLETVRLGDVRAASGNRNNDEPAIEALCRDYGTTTEMAFRAAVDGLVLEKLLVEAGVSEAARRALTTWRRTLTPVQMS
jgi:protein-tyrosine phosphatase